MALTRVPASGVITGTTFTFNSLNVTATTVTSSTGTGALVLSGGLGVGGSTFIGGNLTVLGTINATVTGIATTATNIAAGTAGQIPYQSSAGVTGFFGPGSYGQFLMSNGAAAPGYQNTLTQVNGNIVINRTTSVSSTSSGALQVAGGVGIAGSLFVGGVITATNVYVNGYAVSTASALTIQGAGVSLGSAGTINFATGTNVTVGSNLATIWLNTSTLMANAVTANNLAGGTAGQFAYQTGAGATSFMSTGSMYVYRATLADSASGSAGSVANALTIGNGLSGTSGTYNGSAAVTISLNTATLMQVAAQVVQSHSTGTGILGSAYNGSTAQTWTLDTSTLMARAVQTVQSLTAGTGLTGSAFNGSTAQTWILNTSTLMQTSVNLSGGSAGSLPYQSAANTTALLGVGTANQILTVNAGATAPQWTSAGSITGVGSVANSLTVNNSNSGAASPATFNGSSAVTISANTVGALSLSAGGTVSGPVAFTGAVTFSGTATYSLSTNTFYTDNILELHVPPGGVNTLWTSDDGKDIGFRFHYYTNSTDTNAALVLANDTKWLEWYGSGAEGPNTFAGTYGGFKTGEIYATRNIGVGYTSAQVGEKLGVNGGAYVNGILTATTFVGALSQSLAAGTGLSGTSYNGSAAVTWTLNTATLMQVATQVVQSHSTGTGILGSSYNGSTTQTWTLDTSTLMNKVVNLASGAAGSIPYQSAANATTYLGIGTNGYILTSNGSVPTWTAASGLSAGSVANSLTMDNSGSGAASGSTFNGSAAQTISYNTIGAAKSGYLTDASSTRQYNSVISLDSRSSNYAPGDRVAGLYADFKQNSTDGLTDGGTYHGVLTFRSYGQTLTDFSGGQAQQIAYTDNNNLWHRISSNSSTWGTWYKIIDTNNTSTAYVGRAVLADSATNLSAGSAMALPYQSASGTTAYLSAGTSGYILQTNGTGSAPTWVAASGLSAGSSTNADNLKTIQQTANATYYPSFVDSNNSTAAYEAYYTTSSFSINAATGRVGLGTTSPNSVLTVFNAATFDVRTSGVNVHRPSSYGQYGSFSFDADTTYFGSTYTGGGAGYYGKYQFNQYDSSGTPITSLFIDQVGKVGIGTTSPGKKLTISRSAETPSDQLEFRNEGGITTGNYDGIIWTQGASGGTTLSSIRINYNSSGAPDMAFNLRNESNVLFLKNGGSVGINTSSPVATMDVRGGLAVSGWSNNNGGSTGGLEIGWDGTQGLIQSYNRTGSAYTAVTLNGSINKFLTAGTERLRITASGGMAFGGASNYGSSGQILQSNGDASPTWVSASTIAAGSAPLTNTYVGYGSASNLLTGSSNLTYASSILNVAYQNTFNATTPGFGTYGIHLNGQTTADYATGITFSAGSASAGNANAGIYSQGSGSYGTRMYLATTDSYATGAKTRVMINESGNVGIGTISPSSRLHVYTGNASGAIAYFEGDSGRYIYTGVDSGHYIEQVGTTAANRVLRIQSSNGSGTYTALYIDGANQRIYTISNASVGIGTSTPSEKLHVSGTIRVDGGGSGVRVFQNGADTITSHLYFANAANGQAWNWQLDSSGHAALFGYPISSGWARALTVRTTGAVAFGTSATAYGSSGQILQSNGDAVPTWVNASSITSGYASNETLSTVATRGNSYINGALGGISIGETFTNYDGWNTQLNVHGGPHARIHVKTDTVRMGIYAHNSWNSVSGTTPGGFVGTYNAYPLSFIVNTSQRMVIDTSGNVGINTTSPSEKLTVNGSFSSVGYTNIGGTTYISGTNANTLNSGYTTAADGADLWINYRGYADGQSYYRNFNVGNGRGTCLLWVHGPSGNVGIGTGQNAVYRLDLGPSGTTTDTHKIRFSVYNGSAGTGGGYNYGSSTGGGTTQGTGIVWVPEYGGYTKRSAGILQIAEGNYFRSGLAFYTNNITDQTTDWTEAMRIGSNGNVQIGGGSSPSLANKFEVDGSNGQLFVVTDSFTGTIFSANDISGIPSIEVLDTGLVKFAQYNGSVAISTSTAVSGSILTVNGIVSIVGSSGELRASSEITAYYSSDARLKENVQVISDPIELLEQINGVYFDWTDEHIQSRGGEDGFFVRKHDIGVIAQEVEAVLPEIVATREDGYKAVKYEKLVPLLIEAVKSQQQTIETLKAELQEIKDLIKGK